MNIEGFLIERKTDPLGRGYANMTREQLYASLTARDRGKLQPLPMVRVLRWAARHDGINVLKAASSSGNKDKRRLADAALTMLTSPHVDNFDVTDPELVAMLDALVALGVFSAAEKADMLQLATETISRLEEIDCGDMSKDYMIYLLDANGL